MQTDSDFTSSLYELPDDHPGVSDQEYRARRAAIATVGGRYQPGDEIPDVHYTPEEDEVWRIVSTELAIKHERYAVGAYRDAAERLALPSDRVPQLRMVNQRLRDLSDFGVRPVPGLVPTRTFYGSLTDRTFMSTQYIRHHSVPFYTPEPDVVHELIGHVSFLADRRIADLYEQAGAASRRATSDEALGFFSRVFWFSIEFGVCWEDDEIRTYGAGLLSSFGEIEEFRKAEIRPFDIGAMGRLEYDITKYQTVLFAGESFPRVMDDLFAFYSAYGEDEYRKRWA